MDFIQWGWDIAARHVSGRRGVIKATQHRATQWRATHSGLKRVTLYQNIRTTRNGKERQNPPTDRDWGLHVKIGRMTTKIVL